MKITTSIFTAVMNRNDTLQKSIDNWLQHDIADEIVVVDWSSSIPFKYDHEKVKIYRVENEKYWVLTQSFNLAAKLTTGDVLIKMDTDYEVTAKFKNLFPIPDNTFYRGTWIGMWNMNSSIDDNGAHMCGFLACKKKLFDEVGGYNEEITTYGYDDDDIQKRLSNIASCLIIHHCDSGIYHKPHDNESRMKNQNINDIQVEIQKNVLISEKNTWSKNSPKRQWSFL